MDNHWNGKGECRVYLTPDQWSVIVAGVGLLADRNLIVRELSDTIISRIDTQVPNLEEV